MRKLILYTFLIYINLSSGYSQFGSVNIDFDYRLLRSDEKQDLINLKQDIKRFFINTNWDNDYSDLSIPLNIQIIFEGSSAKGNVKTYLCKAFFSNGSDLRYFDNAVQFYYSSGSNLYFDLVLFEPLSGFLAFYAQLILAGEIDTYSYRGGNKAFEIAREISLRGTSSEYQKGWLKRTAIADHLTSNTGLRSARLNYFTAYELFQSGLIEESIESYEKMFKGIEQSYFDYGREKNTQYFMKVHSNQIAKVFQILGRKSFLERMLDLDPDNKEIYQTSLDTISK